MQTIKKIGHILITVIIAVLIFTSQSLAMSVQVTDYDESCNYLELIQSAVEDGSEYALQMGALYEKARNLKIYSEQLDTEYTYFFTRYSTPKDIQQAIDNYIYYGNKTSPYKLSDEEREYVERAVMTESGGESYEGQLAVSQAILDGTLRKDLDVVASIKSYQICAARVSVTQSVKDAVSAVFDYGERVTEHPIDLWYATYITSTWHESQQFVIEIGLHRFFWMNG